MFKNYLGSALRFIWRNKVFASINLLGLLIALTVSFIMLLYVINELSYNRYNKNIARVYRVLNYYVDFKKTTTGTPYVLATALEKEFPNFRFYLVLSEPLPEDNWVPKKDATDKVGDGFVGFVHQAVIDQYLNQHEAPEDIEFYFCGPPMMNKAVVKMCDDFGVPKENVRFDDFGG